MFGSNVLEFAIGMIFVYLLLILTCSAVNEFIEARLKNRAADLQRGLRELFNDPTGTGLVKQLYEHPLVYGLFKGGYQPGQTSAGMPAIGSDLPSYIPARSFALAFLDIVSKGPPTTPPLAGTGAGGGTGVAPAAGAPGATANPIDAIRANIATIQSPFVQRALTTLVDASGNSVDKLLEGTETWYNSTMERVSGWYKRRVQWIIIVLAVLLTTALNADTLAIANHLSQDATLRKAMVDAATTAAQKKPEDGTPPETRLKQNMDSLSALGLPLGWVWPDRETEVNGSQPAGVAKALDPRQPPRTVGGWLAKIVGLLMTAFAISLGAPFWFDLLNKVVGLRSSLKPEAKSPAKS